MMVLWICPLLQDDFLNFFADTEQMLSNLFGSIGWILYICFLRLHLNRLWLPNFVTKMLESRLK